MFGEFRRHADFFRFFGQRNCTCVLIQVVVAAATHTYVFFELLPCFFVEFSVNIFGEKLIHLLTTRCKAESCFEDGKCFHLSDGDSNTEWLRRRQDGSPRIICGSGGQEACGEHPEIGGVVPVRLLS